MLYFIYIFIQLYPLSAHNVCLTPRLLVHRHCHICLYLIFCCRDIYLLICLYLTCHVMYDLREIKCMFCSVLTKVDICLKICIYLARILHTVSCVFLHPTTFPPPCIYTKTHGASTLSHCFGLYTVTGIPSEIKKDRSSKITDMWQKMVYRTLSSPKPPRSLVIPANSIQPN